LLEYLQRPEIVEELIAARALEGSSWQDVTNSTLKPDWSKLLANLDAGTESLKQIFLR
jgi:hypothetical protein